jgi:hypothetical protein
MLGSARARRERYVGEWLPEPLPERTEWVSGLPDGITGDPADRVTLDESIGMAFLMVLESMTPAERVTFVLHDVFRYSFGEIAEIVGRTPAACGLASAHVHPIEGGEQIARAWIEIARATPGLTFLERTVNGQPGLVAELNGAIVTVYAFSLGYSLLSDNHWGRGARGGRW